MPIITTDGKAITSPSRDFVTIYAPDGTPHECAPIDAREILAGDGGYSAEPPQKHDEQQPEPQSVVGNTIEANAEDVTEDASGAESVQVSEAVKVTRRSRK